MIGALLLAFLLTAAPSAAADRFTEFRSGPFEVWTEAGEKEGRRTLAYFEQLRHTLESMLGKQELRTVWPVRVLIRDDKRAPAIPPRLVRDAWLAALPKDTPIPRAFTRAMAALLLDSGARRLPAHIENGLLDLVAGISVEGVRVTLAVPPPAERSRDWARLHMLASDPEFSGKVRVLLANLERGADLAPACHNAFEKKPEQIEARLEEYLRAGQFAPVAVNARPINPDRDFPPRPVSDARGGLALADLDDRAPAYASLPAPESKEGLGWLALRGGRKAGARKLFEEALAAGSKSAFTLLEAGKIKEAITANPRWSEPFLRLAGEESDPARQAFYLEKAAALEPRNAALWQQLAETQLDAKQFTAASRSFTIAEQAAATPEERARLKKLREEFAVERRRREQAEQDRIAEERRNELERLRAQAEAEVRAAEARANQGKEPRDPNRKVEEWWDDPRAVTKLRGTLERVDCLPGGKARLTIRGEGAPKPVALLIREPGKVAILGGGEKTLTCGPQKPPRAVQVEYAPNADAKLGTAGDLTLVEFR